MKKELNVVLVFSLVIVLSLSIISASVVGDFFNKLFGREVQLSPPSDYVMYKSFDNENTNSLDGFGKAASFNGNGQLKNIGNFDSSVSGNAVNEFSTCFWFNWQGSSQSTVDSRRQNMFDHSAWPSKGFFIELNENQNIASPGILIYLLPGYDGIKWLPFGLPQKNTWHHLCLTYDSGVYNAYLDGVKSANSQTANYIYPSSSNIYLGGAGGRWFNGLIDEVYVYPYALSDSQVKALASGGQTTPEPTPIPTEPTPTPQPTPTPSCTVHSSSSCYNNDVYWVNSCGNREEVKQDCGENSNGAWSANYCQEGNVWHKRDTYARGCDKGACYERTYPQSAKVQDCVNGCEAGVCKQAVSPTPEQPPICTPDCSGKQCGSDGCGGVCGSCSQGSECDSVGLCRVIGTPSVCGVCKTGEICNEKTKTCVPAQIEKIDIDITISTTKDVYRTGEKIELS